MENLFFSGINLEREAITPKVKLTENNKPKTAPVIDERASSFTTKESPVKLNENENLTK